MVDEIARDRAIYQGLKATDEVAAALQAFLVGERQVQPDTHHANDTQAGGAASALKLLQQARARLAEGLRAIEAHTMHEADGISLRNSDAKRAP